MVEDNAAFSIRAGFYRRSPTGGVAHFEPARSQALVTWRIRVGHTRVAATLFRFPAVTFHYSEYQQLQKIGLISQHSKNYCFLSLLSPHLKSEPY